MNTLLSDAETAGPKPLAFSYPEELLTKLQWCVWRIEPDKKTGKPTKVPYRPNGRKASSTDPATWSSFEAAQAAHLAQPELNRGVGYFFAEDDGLCGVDLDTSLDADGKPYAWAVEILARFRDTYTAFSVSGTGLHLLCRAHLEKGRNYYVPEGPSDANGKAAQIGLFDRARFFALTGRPLPASTSAIVDHQADIDWLVSRMQKRIPKQSSTADLREVSLSDDVIVQKAIRAKNGAKFERLWKGEWEAEYGSQSEADLAFCCMLAFWCQGDAAKIEALFGKSGLAREKWTERQDYRVPSASLRRAVPLRISFVPATAELTFGRFSTVAQSPIC